MSWGIECPVVDYKGPKFGARTILRDFQIDIVPDRFAMTDGSESERKEMSDWLNKIGIPRLRNFVKKHRIVSSEHYKICIVRDGYTLVADPRKSYGYLYIGCWLGETEKNME